LREPLEAQKVFEGRLVGFDEGRVKMGLDDERIVELELSNISKARLLPNCSQGMSRFVVSKLARPDFELARGRQAGGK